MKRLNLQKIQELFNSNQLNYTSFNGYIQIIERTNIKQVFPIIYKPDNHTIKLIIPQLILILPV